MLLSSLWAANESKLKFSLIIQHVAMKITIVLGAIASAVLLFFGFIFLLSAGSITLTSAQQVLRLVEGAILLIAGFAIAYVAYVFSRKPTTVIQQLELSGQMKAAAIKCPRCSASVDANQIKIVAGVPYATCPYCGNTFEVVEEPKW
jgi:Zn finger protein HypA/HybF involved in hydrogenase expression